MKCQSLFSGKSKKNVTSLSSAKLAERVIMVNLQRSYFHGAALLVIVCKKVKDKCYF